MKYRVLALAALVLLPLARAETTPAAAPKAVALPASDADYDLRGFFGAGDDLEVSLARKGEKESRWYRVGKKSGGLTVERADAAAGYAVLARGDTRTTVRLAAASAPAKPAAEDNPDAPAPAEKPDLSSREYRRKRMKEMMEQSSPAQQAEFQRVMRDKFTALMKEQPDLFKDMGSPESRRRVGDLSLGIMHDAAEASAKIPGKDGSIKPLPADFDALMRAEHADNMTRWEKAEAARKAATPAADSPPENTAGTGE